MFVKADTQTFCPFNVEVYKGKSINGNKSEDIVIRLISHLPPGHELVVDNFLHPYVCLKIIRTVYYTLFWDDEKTASSRSKINDADKANFTKLFNVSIFIKFNYGIIHH